MLEHEQRNESDVQLMQKLHSIPVLVWSLKPETERGPGRSPGNFFYPAWCGVLLTKKLFSLVKSVGRSLRSPDSGKTFFVNSVNQKQFRDAL